MEPKQKHEEAIIKAITEATAAGFEVCVASDPEGNSYNSINPAFSLYDGTKPKKIVLGVHREIINEEELFEDQNG